MKKAIFYIIIIILLIPAIEKQTQIIQFEKLSGAFIPINNINLSIERWLNTNYQTQKELYIKNNIGLKPFFIRLYNQISFSLFKKANNPNGVVGKDNYLYLTDYIYNQTGENFVGNNVITERVSNLKYLHEFFKTKNITLLTVFLPSKASFYPEYIPDNYKKFPNNNYNALINAYDSLGLNYIDINKYFTKIKDTTSIPLFPKNGLHWTSYGMALGMDTLIKSIENYKKIDIPDFSWELPMFMDKKIHKPDNDAEKVMNLLFELPSEPMPYPKFIYKNDSTKTKPKTLVICDSYYWQPYEQYVHHNVFDWGGFWFYFNTARQGSNNIETTTPVDDLDLIPTLLKQDIIVLFASQATLHLFPYDFDTKAKYLFMPHDSLSLIKYFTNEIKNDQNLINKLTEKAKQNNINFEKQLAKDVQLKADNYIRKNYAHERDVNDIIKQIRNSPELTKYVKDKAKKQNISFKEMLKLDAEWEYNKRKIKAKN